MPVPQPSQTIYAFVDETGQDTKGEMFIVSVVVTDEEYERINKALIEIEQRSNKRLDKWRKARFKYRLAYIQAIIANPLLTGAIFFSHYTESQDYFELTVETTARAIQFKAAPMQPATIVVDGLSGQSIDRFKKSLRQRQINTRKVRGVRDESEPIIRLADAVAGFVRDFIEGQAYAAEHYEQAVKSGVLREL